MQMVLSRIASSPRRRLRTVTFLLVCIGILYVSLTQRKAGQYDILQGNDDACARLQHFSPFREHANHTLEEEINLALLDIERQSSQAASRSTPVRKIWQIWRDEKIPDRFSQSQEWREKHPGWEYELITDQEAIEFISAKLSTIPHLEADWISYPRQVIQTDILRYLLLWYWGGFYADIDIVPKLPLTSCQPLQSLFSASSMPNISLVVGVEIDEPYASAQKRKAWKWSRTHQFIQYTMYAPQRFSPILRKTIVRAIAHSRQHQKESSTWYRSSGYFDNNAVLETTGPGMFTDAILDTLSETLPPTHPMKVIPKQIRVCSGSDSDSDLNREARGTVSWLPFHGLRSSLWLNDTSSFGLEKSQTNGGLLVLPVNVWGNGQRHSGAKNFFNADACLNHKFAGAWKHPSFWSRLQFML